MSDLVRAVQADTETFLPERVPPFEAVLARKRARDRRVRVGAGAMVAAVAVAFAVVVPGVGAPQDRLAPAAADPAGDAPPLAALQATAQAEIVGDDGEPRLAVEAGGGPVSVEVNADGVIRGGLHLTFTTLTGQGESFAPWPLWSEQVAADEGPGVLGIGGMCGLGWDSVGNPISNDPCAGAMLVMSAEPGFPTEVSLVMYPRVGDARVLPGTYRASVDLMAGDTLRVTVQVTERTPSVDPSLEPSDVEGDLVPPPAADRLVLCQTSHRSAPPTGRADCAVTSDNVAIGAVRTGLADAERSPSASPSPGIETGVCAIAADSWDLIWLDGEAITDRVTVPDATCLTARRADGIAYTVSAPLIGALRALYEAEAGQGGAFDGAADPAPPAALCARTYPQDLPARPLAFDAVVLGIADTDPADAPESPGVPFSDVDLLVLNTYAGQPAGRLVVRALIGQPDPTRAVGERLLVATEPPAAGPLSFLGSCGFTQPYSTDTAEQWADAFR